MSSQNSEINAAWSKQKLAALFQIDRRTVDKILLTIDPIESGKPNPKWGLQDAIAAFVASKTAHLDFSGADLDPSKLAPKQRKEYYDAKLKEVEYGKVCGDLVRTPDLRHMLSEIYKTFVSHFENISDIMEREVDLTPEQTASLSEKLDAIREELFNSLLNLGG